MSPAAKGSLPHGLFIDEADPMAPARVPSEVESQDRLMYLLKPAGSMASRKSPPASRWAASRTDRASTWETLWAKSWAMATRSGVNLSGYGRVQDGTCPTACIAPVEPLILGHAGRVAGLKTCLCVRHGVFQ